MKIKEFTGSFRLINHDLSHVYFKISDRIKAQTGLSLTELTILWQKRYINFRLFDIENI
jgi:hypothetical protein